MVFNEIVFAGHSACFFHAENFTLAVDPWLQANPSCPDSLKEPKKIDVIVLTHGHADHAGEAAALAKSHGAKLVATYELATLMGKEGVPESNLVPMNKGGTVRVNDIVVTLTHAMHSNSYDAASGTHYAGEACGVVLGDGTRNIYHAGDTALFSDMTLIKDQYLPEIALLPIGDRFTMGPKEAAKAAQLVGCKRAIPIHYGTFGLLTGTAEEFSSECSHYDVEPVVIAPGESLKI